MLLLPLRPQLLIDIEKELAEVDELEAALVAYPSDGSAWSFQETGLLQAVSGHIAARKPGLVNVQRPSRKQSPGPLMPVWH
jgi:hypothetical protein